MHPRNAKISLNNISELLGQLPRAAFLNFQRPNIFSPLRWIFKIHRIQGCPNGWFEQDQKNNLHLEADAMHQSREFLHLTGSVFCSEPVTQYYIFILFSYQFYTDLTLLTYPLPLNGLFQIHTKVDETEISASWGWRLIHR